MTAISSRKAPPAFRSLVARPWAKQLLLTALTAFVLWPVSSRAESQGSFDPDFYQHGHACLQVHDSPTLAGLDDLIHEKLVKAKNETAIRQHTITVGMTFCEVILSWGDGWIGRFLYFDDHLYERVYWDHSTGRVTLYFDNEILYKYEN